nr:MAG TPA: hypothetical protein [Caudoviricetes sp.]
MYYCLYLLRCPPKSSILLIQGTAMSEYDRKENFV